MNGGRERSALRYGAPLVLTAAIVLASSPAGSAPAVQRLWMATYNGPASGLDSPADVGTSPGGGTVYVTGESGIGDAVRDFATVAYAASDGTELWASRYDGPDARSDSATALVVGPEGSRIYVTGISEDSAGRSQFATVAYDTLTGTELWSARYGTDSGGAYAWDIDVSV